MSPLLGFLLLLLLAVGWTTLPLLPALRELFSPTDVDPLTMVGRDNADISRFARHFRDYVQANLRQLPPEGGADDSFGKLPDGTQFVRIAQGHAVARAALPDGTQDRLVVLEHPTTLPGGEQFRLEVWARAALTGGEGATYRAVLSEDVLRLGAHSTVMRWVHSRGPMDVAAGSTLYGRASSEQGIRLGRDVAFERVGAPVITVGDAMPSHGPPAAGELVEAPIPEDARRLGDHLRVEGDFWLPPHSVVDGNLVVAGELRLGAGARVKGSVKAHRAIELEEGAVVEGSVVSERTIRLGPSTWVRGPVIAEDSVTIASAATVGARTQPTTVSARTLSLAQGVAVCGHLVTQEGGHTDLAR